MKILGKQGIGRRWAPTLIIVAMIGVLAAIAIPSFEDYAIRAQVSEGIHLSEDLRALVTEYVRDNRKWPTNNNSVGLAAAETITGPYVSGVAVQDGVVLVTYGGGAHANIQGKSIVLSLEASNPPPTVIWICNSLEIKE